MRAKRWKTGLFWDFFPSFYVIRLGRESHLTTFFICRSGKTWSCISKIYPFLDLFRFLIYQVISTKPLHWAKLFAYQIAIVLIAVIVLQWLIIWRVVALSLRLYFVSPQSMTSHRKIIVNHCAKTTTAIWTDRTGGIERAHTQENE